MQVYDNQRINSKWYEIRNEIHVSLYNSVGVNGLSDMFSSIYSPVEISVKDKAWSLIKLSFK